MLPNVCMLFLFFLHEQRKTFMLSTALDLLSCNIQSLVGIGGFKTNRTNRLSVNSLTMFKLRIIGLGCLKI